MGFLRKVKKKVEATAKKGVDVGKDVGEKGLDVGKNVGKKGVELGKTGVEKTKDTVKCEDDPLKILKIRSAKGEISKNKYAEMKKILEG